jgi:dCMP deaminase
MEDNFRISRENLYAEMAQLFAKRGSCRRLQVGCIAVKDGRVICTGYNGPPKGSHHCGEKLGCDITKPCTHAIHAEANMIAFAARNGIPLEGATIWTTHMPCIKCAELIIQTGFKEVRYLKEFRDTEGGELLNKCGIKVVYHIWNQD